MYGDLEVAPAALAPHRPERPCHDSREYRILSEERDATSKDYGSDHGGQRQSQLGPVGQRCNRSEVAVKVHQRRARYPAKVKAVRGGKEGRWGGGGVLG